MTDKNKKSEEKVHETITVAGIESLDIVKMSLTSDDLKDQEVIIINDVDYGERYFTVVNK